LETSFPGIPRHGPEEDGASGSNGCVDVF
jgi:hypothetical protein